MSDPKIGRFGFHCAARGCENCFYYDIVAKDYRNKKFFRFPQEKDPTRRQKWFEIMGLPYTTQRMNLCEDHFKPKYFTDTFKRRLIKFALPSPPLTDIKIEPVPQTVPNTCPTTPTKESINIDEILIIKTEPNDILELLQSDKELSKYGVGQIKVQLFFAHNMSDPKIGRLGFHCAARGCENCFYYDIVAKDYRNKKFFRFPQEKDPTRRQKWFEIMGLPYTTQRMNLCEDHFKLKYFTDTFKRRLIKFALPSPYLTDIKIEPVAETVPNTCPTTPTKESINIDEILIIKTEPNDILELLQSHKELSKYGVGQIKVEADSAFDQYSNNK